MLIITTIWLAILLFKVFLARISLDAPRQDLQRDLSCVTVMQPILSGDPALETVLDATLQNLPEATFLWLIDVDDAEAARVTQRLQARYRHQQIHICLCPDAPEGVNPKLCKLEQGRKQVKTPLVLVLDDDAVLTASSLNMMIEALEGDSLVTALPWYRTASNMPSRLLAQFVNDNSALTYLPLLPFARPLTINGMCYLLPLRVLESVGGFTPVLRHLTDDLALATLLTRAGVNIVQSVAPVCVQTSVPTVSRYFRQMHRWFLFATLLMREKSVGTNIMILLLQGIHPLLLWAMVILAFGSVMNGVVLVVALCIRHVALGQIQRRVSVMISARPVMSVLSELLQPVHLVHALVNRTIYWRSRRYRIFSNDHFRSL
ncbi:glycosyltransferase [Atlantibacter hermannii]|uniref:glycosyltransferase n=1 Tax=Atlantibacter hermannii TaxID=565 RepID=UPI0028AB5DFE|nr:glycosyltransferase [Atlantibacter hermannii]